MAPLKRHFFAGTREFPSHPAEITCISRRTSALPCPPIVRSSLPIVDQFPLRGPNWKRYCWGSGKRQRGFSRNLFNPTCIHRKEDGISSVSACYWKIERARGAAFARRCSLRELIIDLSERGERTSCQFYVGDKLKQANSQLAQGANWRIVVRQGDAIRR